MANSLHRSALTQLAIIALAVIGTFASFSATASPAYAATGGGYYQAQLAAPVDGARTEILRGVVWKCAGADCSAGKNNSRPEIVCARLARKVGTVAAFAVQGEALDPAALAKCNGEESAPLARR